VSLRPLGHPSLEPTVLKYPAEKPPENAPWNRLGRPLSITSDTRRPRALPRKRGGGLSSLPTLHGLKKRKKGCGRHAPSVLSGPVLLANSPKSDPVVLLRSPLWVDRSPPRPRPGGHPAAPRAPPMRRSTTWRLSAAGSAWRVPTHLSRREAGRQAGDRPGLCHANKDSAIALMSF